MRTITIKAGLAVDIDALSRRQIENLKAKGFAVSTASIAGVTGLQFDDFVDALVEAYVGDHDRKVRDALLDAGGKHYRDVARQLIAETWGNEDEEKNS